LSLPLAFKHGVCLDTVVKGNKNRRSRRYDHITNTQIAELMSNKDEWIKLIETQYRLHPMLIVLLITLLILNIVFVILGANQYLTCSEGIQRIKSGLRMAINTFEVAQGNIALLIDSTLFNMINEYLIQLL
jgi:hypothetical protein